VVDLSLSSDEEGLIHDTSRDEKFTRRFFGDLNHDVLEPPGVDKVIIFSDSNEEEEEVHEETTADTDATPSSPMRSPTPTVDTDEDPKGMQDDNSVDLVPEREIGDSSNGGDETSSP
jgi:hypothetical protein